MKLLTRVLAVAACLLPWLAAAQPVLSPPESQCLLVPVRLEERAARAAVVVEAEVQESRSFWDAAHQHIYTAHQLRVFSRFKGSLPQQLTVLTEGGTVGLNRHELTNTLRLQPGEQGVLFLVPATFAGTGLPDAWEVYSSKQGFIRYNLPDATAADPFQTYPQINSRFYQLIETVTGQARREVQPNTALAAALQQVAAPVLARGQAPVVNSLSPATVPAGVDAVLTINGSGFGAVRGNGFVEFRNADNGGSSFVKPQESDYVSWDDTRIQVRVPSLSQAAAPAGSGPVRVTTSGQLQTTSTALLTVPYALSNVQANPTNEIVRPNPTNENNRGGYSFRFEAGFAGNAAAAAAWRRALATWRCQTRMNWEVDSQVRTGRGAADDGENSVGFDQGAELPAGILGRTTSRYQGCFRPNGQLAFSVHEIDMQFDDATAWQFGPAPAVLQQLDFESVAVHELGHAQQLSHVILPGAVMHYAIARAQNTRAISLNDIAGGRRVLRTRGFVPQGCGPAPMLPAPLTSLAATAAAGSIAVAWTTTNECFAETFDVQRSRDTLSWQTLATVASPGPYRFLDGQTLPGLAYYRLRLLHPDGSVAFTPPVLVASTDDPTIAPALFPNPAGAGPVRLQYTSATAGRASLTVYDAIGRQLSRTFLDYQPGLNLLPVPTAGLSPGWYLVRYVDSESRTGTLPFLKTSE